MKVTVNITGRIEPMTVRQGESFVIITTFALWVVRNPRSPHKGSWSLKIRSLIVPSEVSPHHKVTEPVASSNEDGPIRYVMAWVGNDRAGRSKALRESGKWGEGWFEFMCHIIENRTDMFLRGGTIFKSFMSFPYDRERFDSIWLGWSRPKSILCLLRRQLTQFL
jgi:hypothetical protein